MGMLGAIIPEALKNLFKKPATTGYPAERPVLASNFRGKIKYIQSLCIGCRLCIKDCPAGAIEIVKVVDRKFKMIYHIDRCIYCGQCVLSCPKKAIYLTDEFELASCNKNSLVEEQGDSIIPETPAQPAANSQPAQPASEQAAKPAENNAAVDNKTDKPSEPAK